MTHRHIRSLLGDYVDSELSEDDKAAVERLLAESAELRSEYEQTSRLKELLRHKHTPDPGEAYFDELSQLILARTVQTRSTVDQTADPAGSTADQRRMFVRSLLSAAVSLMLFFAAIMIGSQQPAPASGVRQPSAGVFLAGAAAEQVGELTPVMATREERTSVTKGIFLLSPPGSIGRLSGLQELLGR
ncbi:hypothetical protein GF420_02745 [candidate division GN15 bacterium]|nr:hypothetical protein [candidate division GN15 bacterium]